MNRFLIMVALLLGLLSPVIAGAVYIPVEDQHTTTQLSGFVVPLGMVVYDSSKDTLVVGDGVTAGGDPLFTAGDTIDTISPMTIRYDSLSYCTLTVADATGIMTLNCVADAGDSAAKFAFSDEIIINDNLEVNGDIVGANDEVIANGVNGEWELTAAKLSLDIAGDDVDKFDVSMVTGGTVTMSITTDATALLDITAPVQITGLVTHKYDAGAYWTATQGDADAGVTLNSVVDSGDASGLFTISDKVIVNDEVEFNGVVTLENDEYITNVDNGVVEVRSPQVKVSYDAAAYGTISVADVTGIVTLNSVADAGDASGGFVISDSTVINDTLEVNDDIIGANDEVIANGVNGEWEFTAAKISLDVAGDDVDKVDLSMDGGGTATIDITTDGTALLAIPENVDVTGNVSVTGTETVAFGANDYSALACDDDGICTFTLTSDGATPHYKFTKPIYLSNDAWADGALANYFRVVSGDGFVIDQSAGGSTEIAAFAMSAGVMGVNMLSAQPYPHWDFYQPIKYERDMVSRVMLEDDFLNLAIDLTEAKTWSDAQATLAGHATIAAVAGSAGGEVKLALEATNEVQIVVLNQNDTLLWDLDNGPVIEFRAKLKQGAVAGSAAVMGLASAYAAATDDVTANAWFKVADIQGSLAVVCESDDDTALDAHDFDDIASGVTLTDDTYAKFRIDATTNTDVKFYINDVQVCGGTTFDMSAYTDNLQPYFVIQKNSADASSMSIDYVKIMADR